MTTASLYDLTILPSVPTLPEWVIDPGRKPALDQCESDIMNYMMSLVASENEVTVAQVLEDTPPINMEMIARASVRSIEHIHRMEGFLERVRTRLSLKVLRVNANYADDNLSFEDMLIKRLGEVKSKSSVSEIKFFLEVLQHLEDWGLSHWIDDLFDETVPFTKFAKSVSELRVRHDAVEAATEISKKIKDQASPKDIEAHEKQLGELENEFRDALFWATKLAKDKTVPVDGPHGMKNSLVKKIREEKAKRTGQTFEHLEPEKPIISKAYSGSSVVYFFSIHQEYEGVVDRLLQEMFDSQMSDLGEMEAEIKFMRNGDKDD